VPVAIARFAQQYETPNMRRWARRVGDLDHPAMLLMFPASVHLQWPDARGVEVKCQLKRMTLQGSDAAFLWAGFSRPGFYADCVPHIPPRANFASDPR
jgi:hypothetical protein